MAIIRSWWSRAAFSLGGSDRQSRLAEELDAHVAMLTEENVRRGMEEKEARRRALLEFGNLPSTREACREQQGFPLIEAFLNDLRIGARSLRKSPGFTIAVTLTLAIAIGANTAIFSLVNQALLHPRGVYHPERIVNLREHYGKLANLSDLGATSTLAFADLRNQRDIFEHTAALYSGFLTLTGRSQPEHLQSADVSVEWFDVLGAKPRLGRTFTEEEEQPNAQRVAILSDATWRKLFGADPTVVNRSIELDFKPYTVIGVMSPGVEWVGPADVWLPLRLEPSDFAPAERFHQFLFVLARLRSGTPLEKANQWLKLRTAQVLASGVPGAKETAGLDWYMFSKSFTDAFSGDTRGSMLLLLTSVGLVLLIASSNIAGVMLARNSARSQEIAVRAALGASRARLLGRIAAEGLLLASVGTLAGVALAWAGMQALVAWLPQDSVPGAAAQLDLLTLLFSATTGAAAGLLFGIIPAWQISRTSLFNTMRSAGRVSGNRRTMRSALVVAEAAMALVLIVAASALLRSFHALEAIPPGFEPKGLQSASLSFPESRYAKPEQQVAFYNALLDGLPSPSAIASSLPFQGGINAGGFEIQGRQGAEEAEQHSDVRFVSAGFFETLRIPVRSGRTFARTDPTGADSVAVIDEIIARRFWPRGDAVGRRIRLRGVESWFTIVGVVGSVRSGSLGVESPRGTIYYPLNGFPQRMPVATVVSQAPFAAIRSAVGRVDPSEALFDTKTMEERVADSLVTRRFVLSLMSFFAGVALLLCGIGLYAVISYAVTQRTREIGIRMALGARTTSVSGMVIREGLVLAAVGIVLGVAVSAALGRLLDTLLFQSKAFNLENVVFAVAVLLAVTILASVMPASKAASVNPVKALRFE